MSNSTASRHTAVVALGANLGDAPRTLSWAKAQLAQLGQLSGASRLYRTRPVGGPPGQPDYFNAVVTVIVGLSPHELLRELMHLERQAGRERRERWGPRVLDLDLLAFDSLTLEGEDLTLPHPRLLERAFVLAPLLDVQPTWVHPFTGETAREALARTDVSGVEPLDTPW